MHLESHSHIIGTEKVVIISMLSYIIDQQGYFFGVIEFMN